MKVILGSTLLLLTLSVFVFGDEEGESIAGKHFGLKKAQDSSSTATMKIAGGAGATKTRKLELFSKQMPGGKNVYINFLGPGDVIGTRLLTTVGPDGRSEQRLWLPALKKTRKIASSGKDGAFVGSDFSFYDMEDRVLSDYTYHLLSKNETLPGSAYAGMVFSKLEMLVVDLEAPYSRVIGWINNETGFLHHMECYGRNDNTLSKIADFSSVESFDGVLVATQITASTPKKGTTTVLTYEGININRGIKDGIFSPQNLEK